MKHLTFWKVAALLFIAGVFYVGGGLRSESRIPQRPMFVSSALADGVEVSTDDRGYCFTASPDGKTLYMWQFFAGKPKFLSQADAVLSQ